MLTEARLERIPGISQLYLKREASGSIVLVVAKVTDDLLIAGSVDGIRALITQLKNRFTISKSIINDKMTFNGCTIEQSANGDIRMSMADYLESIPFISLARGRRKQQSENATQGEANE